MWQAAAVNDHLLFVSLFSLPQLGSALPLLLGFPVSPRAPGILPDFPVTFPSWTHPSPGGPAGKPVLEQDVLSFCADLTDSLPL